MNLIRGKAGTQQQLHAGGKTDTLSAVAVDMSGDVCAAVTTSGMSFKQAGRVGDSPVPGAGLYADAESGAAVATGTQPLALGMQSSMLANY